MTDMTQRPFDRDAPASPFDGVGVACLAWAGVFIALTAVLAIVLN
ncbi:MAG TPA: hypothetical protein VJP88_11685 [Caulobacteraceae bacterium]|nr:hypothetical protein [Caulobacteraceae bacterium]